MRTPRDCALLCLLLLGCFFTSLTIYGDNGFYLESVEDFNWLPLPLLGPLRQRWLLSNYVTHGFLYAFGLPVLGAALALLYSPRFFSLSRLVLGLALLWKIFLLSADVRFWSTNELIHLACSGVFLAGGGLSALRLVMATLLISSGCNDLYHQGTSLAAALQVGASLLWLFGRDQTGWGAALLTLLLFYYGVEDHSYRTVLLLPLLLLCSQHRSPPPRPNRATLLALAGLAPLALLTVLRPLFILSPARTPVTAWIQMRKGEQRHVLRIRYPRINMYDTNDYRMEILRYSREGGKRQAVSVLEPISDGPVTLFDLGLFNQRPEILREPYLYDYYFHELVRRWRPEFVKIRATWGNEVIFERQHGY